MAKKKRMKMKMDERVQRVLDNGWFMMEEDCACGGKYVWVRPTSSLSTDHERKDKDPNAFTYHGCVCHTDLPYLTEEGIW